MRNGSPKKAQAGGQPRLLGNRFWVRMEKQSPEQKAEEEREKYPGQGGLEQVEEKDWCCG